MGTASCRASCCPVPEENFTALGSHLWLLTQSTIYLVQLKAFAWSTEYPNVPWFCLPFGYQTRKNVFWYITSSFQVPAEAENKTSNVEYIFFSFKNLNSLIWIFPCLPAFKKNVPGKNLIQPEGFSLSIFLCYLQEKLSSVFPRGPGWDITANALD